MYIIKAEPYKDISQIDSCAYLVDTPKLHLICNAKWGQWLSTPIDVLIQDIFEVKNPDFQEHPYLLLPTGNPSIIVVLDSENPRSFLCGPLTTARRISVPAKGYIFCIRLVPGSMNWFVSEPVFNFVNQVIPLSRYVVQEKEFLQFLCNVHTYEERCMAVLSFLDYNIRSRFYVKPMIQEIIQHINKCKGRFYVYDVAKLTDCGERYVTRVFRDTVGLTIKAYGEIVKFQHSLYSIAKESPRFMSSVARTHGYYDLPHMNHAYKKYFGYTANDIKDLDAESVYVPDLFDNG